MKIRVYVLILIILMPIVYSQEDIILPDFEQIQREKDIANIQSNIAETKSACVSNLASAQQLNNDIPKTIDSTLKQARILSFLSVFSATFLAFTLTQFLGYLVERKKRLLYKKKLDVNYGIQK